MPHMHVVGKEKGGRVCGGREGRMKYFSLAQGMWGDETFILT